LSGTKTFWDKIGTVNDTWIYLITLFLAGLMIFTPPSVPEVISYTYDLYDYVETLEEGDLVVCAIGNSYAWFLSHLPAFTAVMHHLIDRNVDFVIFCHFNDGINAWVYDIYPALKVHMDEMGYVYGENYAIMPFIPGEETAAAAFAADMWTIPQDWFGNSFEDLPIMEIGKSAEDWRCAVEAGWIDPWVIRQWWAKYDTDILFLGHPYVIGTGPPQVQAGQIVSFLAGWEGGAQYEKLIGRPGLASRGGTIVSILYFVCCGLIIVGNLAYFGKKYAGGS
jgi:hypothetical protein